MICKNCANIFSDDLDACPECGTPVRSAHKDDREEIEKLVSLAFSDTVAENPSSQEYEDVFSYSDDQLREIENSEEISEKEMPEEEVKYAYALTEETLPEQEETKVEKAAENQTKPARKDAKLPKMNEKEKSAYVFILSLMVVLFAGIIALAGIRMGTDVFEKDRDSVKAIALSGLTAEETAGLEEYLSKIGIMAYMGFDRDKAPIVDVMEYFRPHDAGGLYNRFYGSAALTANMPDPAGRFKNENGDYSYYILEADKVDPILETFGYSSNHNVNEKNFYCYDGKYYFANLSDFNFSPAVYADVSSSKRIQDGRYYVECSFYDSTAPDVDRNFLKTYIILDRITDETGEEISWEVCRISHEELFDSATLMIKDAGEQDELSYKIETKTLEALTERGEVYARYILEYPVFSGDTKGEKIVNKIFEDLVRGYNADTETVTKEYDRFIKKTGTADELPYVTYVVARVTYNRNGYISIVEGISEGKPQSVYKKQLAQIPEGQFRPVVLPERTIDSYTIDVETGEFITKKDIIDVEYTLVHKILYRIYNGYEFESLLDESIVSTEVIPQDTENLGMTLYEASSALGYSGFVFCYVTPEGYTDSVVVPYDTENFFSEEFEARTRKMSE